MQEHSQTDSTEPSRFLGLPSSVVGRATLALALVVVASVALMAVGMESVGGPWRMAFGLFIVAAVIATAVLGLAAVFGKRERSVFVIVPTVLCLAVFGNELIQQLRAAL